MATRSSSTGYALDIYFHTVVYSIPDSNLPFSAQRVAYPLVRAAARDTGERFGVLYINREAEADVARVAADPTAELTPAYDGGAYFVSSICPSSMYA